MDSEQLQVLQNNIKEASAFIKPLKTEINRIIAGQEYIIDRLIMALIADGHVLLEGLPGLAKTLTVKTISQALNGDFSRIQFTPDMLPADVIGTRIYNQNEAKFSTKKGPIFGNLILADEINRAPAKVQSALLECMQEKQVTIADETFKMPVPFMVMATQNPIEQEGTYPLPEAQVDRFIFKLLVEYPQRIEEKLVIERMAHPEFTPQGLSVATLDDIENARKWVDKVYIDEKIIEYILDIVIATRPGHESQLSERQNNLNIDAITPLIEVGASPRAAIYLVIASKALAFMQGRAYVIPQDVKDIAHDVLRHRLLLGYEAEAEGLTTDNIISTILDELRTP